MSSSKEHLKNLVKKQPHLLDNLDKHPIQVFINHTPKAKHDLSCKTSIESPILFPKSIQSGFQPKLQNQHQA